MIRFCDVEEIELIYNGTHIENWDHEQKLVWGGSVFKEANAIFAQGGIKSLPVYNQDGELDCFCYNCGDYRYDQVFSFLKLLDSIDDIIDFLEYMDSKAEVLCIHELNELSYELYRMAIKHRVDIIVDGENWEKLGVLVEKREGKNVFHLYAENQSDIIKNVGENFRPFIQAGIKLGRNSLQRVLGEINPTIPFCICKIPVSNPFVTEWTKAFNAVRDVHNKIQGYEQYCDKEEEKAVKDIYGISRWEAKKETEDCLLLSLSKHFNAFSYSTNRQKNRLYVIGPCIIRGYCVSGNKTLAYRLHEKIAQDEYEVVRIVLSKIDWIMLDKIKELPIRQGDIVMLVADTESLWGIELPEHIKELDLSICYNNMGMDRPYFADCPIHVNESGHSLLAEYIYKEYLKSEIYMKQSVERKYIQKGEILSLESRRSIEQYVRQYSDVEIGNTKNAAIVMNCNPFTFGHRYLIEYAAKEVDKLYIFVVQENKSEFAFEDRFQLVQEGVRDLTNVSVIPSGNFVISYNTLPSYFEKETINNIMLDASRDLEIFARYIAPRFGISRRYVGEEPIDNITRQYNEQMKSILPEFGIELCEIPRLIHDDEVISASKVRRAVKENDWGMIEKIVPETTYKYLIDKFK